MRVRVTGKTAGSIQLPIEPPDDATIFEDGDGRRFALCGDISESLLGHRVTIEGTVAGTVAGGDKDGLVYLTNVVEASK